MADNIAKLSVMVTANASPMNSAIDQGIAKLKDLDKATGGIGSGIVGSLGGIGTNIGTILGGDIGKGVNGLLEGLKGVPPGVKAATSALAMIPGYGPAIQAVADATIGVAVQLKDFGLGALQTFVDMGERGMASIRQQAKLARQFGTSMASAAGLTLLASQTGQDVGEMGGAMQRLGRSMTQARGGAYETQHAFQRLGVSTEMLAGGDEAAILGRIAESIQSNGDAAQNNARLYTIFGRQARSIIPILYEQGDAIGEATARAQRFGLVATESETAMVKAANKSRQRMAADWSALWQGLDVRAGVALAPVWDGIATGFGMLINKAEPFFAAVRTGIDEVGKLMKWFVDGFNEGLKLMGPDLDQAFRAFKDIADIFRTLISGSGMMESSTRSMGQIVVGMVVVGLRTVAGTVLEIAEVSLRIYENFRNMVRAVDTLINGARTLYATLRSNARAFDPTRVINPLTGEEITAGITSWLPAASTAVSNLAGNLIDLSEALRQVQLARDRLARAPIVQTLSRDQAARFVSSMLQMGMLARGNPMRNAGLDEDTFDKIIHDLERTGRQATLTAAEFQRQEWRGMGMSFDQLGEAMARFAANQRATLEVALRDPFETVTHRLTELNTMFSDTLAIDRYNRAIEGTGLAWMTASTQVGTYTRAADQAIETMLRASGAFGNSQASAAPAALSQDSAAAINAINAAQRADADPIMRMADNVEEQLRVQREQRDLNRQVLEELRRRGVVTTLDLPPGG